jgi:hypothetical protein
MHDFELFFPYNRLIQTFIILYATIDNGECSCGDEYVLGLGPQ